MHGTKGHAKIADAKKISSVTVLQGGFCGFLGEAGQAPRCPVLARQRAASTVECLRLAVADNHALVRQGLSSLLALEPGLAVVAEASRADELAQMLERIECDILLLDLQLDRDVLPELSSLASRVKVIVFSASEKPERARAAIRGGARAFVLKRYAVDSLMDAIRAVAAGQVWIPAQFQSCVLEDCPPTEEDRLTPRERQIVLGVCRGMKNAEIAQELFISEVTVKTHLNNIFHKLGVRDRVGLVLFASKTGLIQLSDLPS